MPDKLQGRLYFLVSLSVGSIVAAYILQQLGYLVSLILWIPALVGALGAARTIRRMSLSRPQIVLDERGIDDWSLGFGIIPWEHVEEAEIATVDSEQFSFEEHYVQLRLRDEQKYIQQMPYWKRLFTAFNKRQGYTGIFLNTIGTDASAEQLLSRIQTRVRK